MRALGDQGRSPRHDEEGRGSDHAGQRRHSAFGAGGAQNGPPAQISGHHQGRGGRRRARHAHCAQRCESGPGISRRAFGGRERFCERRALHGEIPRKSAPYRNSDSRRQLRQCDPSRRARLQRAAAQPEADRGSAVAGRCRRGSASGSARRRSRRPRRPATRAPERSSFSTPRTAISISWR